MWICPVCATKSDGPFCSSCGFDRSCDYEKYPTFAKVSGQAVSARKAAYEDSLRPKTCPICGRELSGDTCDYCGFRVAGVQSALVNALAQAHRQKLLETVTDISVVNYEYTWNQELSRLMVSDVSERKLADGKQCSPGVFWTEPLFAQLDPDDYPAVEMLLHYCVNGQKKSLKLNIPTIQCDDFWRMGLLIDGSLRLCVFLGSPAKFTVSEPIELELN